MNLQRETSFIRKTAVSITSMDPDSNLEVSSPEASAASCDLISKKRSRGKGLLWEDHLDLATGDFEYYSSLTDVVNDASNCNYGKISSTATEQRYRCRVKGCNFMRKYTYDRRYMTFVSYNHGLHEHAEESPDCRTQRGLSQDQKAWVHEAFSLKNRSATEIVQFFRWKRNCFLAAEVDDPKISVLNNYIQNYKKKKSAEYYPSANDLKEWCDSHSPTSVDMDDKETFNTPFVLDYIMVKENEIMYDL